LRTHLFAGYWIANQRQEHQLLKPRQRVQVCQLGDPVLGENQRLQIRYAGREGRLDVRYAVLRQEQCAQARLQWKVAKLRDVVVGEVDCVVVLCLALLVLCSKASSCSGN
jgi:hypothetical protein